MFVNQALRRVPLYSTRCFLKPISSHAFNIKYSTLNDNDNPKMSSSPPSSKFSLSQPIESLIIKYRLTKDHDLARLIAKSIVVSGGSLVGISILGTLGFDTAPLLTGIGVTGFTLGFALKEIATNFLSGIFLVFNKPFQKGQNLRVITGAQPLEGIVESIDARYVILRTKENGMVMIPSIVVYTNPIHVSDGKK